MKWFMNFTIRAKLILGFGAVIALAIALAVFGIIQLNSMGDEYNDLFDGAVMRSTAAMRAQSNIRSLRRTLTATVMHAPTANAEAINALRVEMETFHERALIALYDYDYSTTNQPGQTDEWRRYRLDASASVRNNLAIYVNEVFLPVHTYALQGNHARALQITTEGAHIVEAIVDATEHLRNMGDTAMASGRANAQASRQSSVNITIAVAVVIVMIAAVIALLIARIISKPIQELVVLTGNVASGKLNMNINRDNLTKDEIGRLTYDVYNLVDVVKGIVQDLTDMYGEYIGVGNMHYQIDDRKYDNSFKEMIALINKLLSQLTSDIGEVENAIKQISNGDFETTVDEAVWVGEWAAMPKALNALIANIKSVEKEINGMVHAAAVLGDLHYRIDENKYDGGWRKIMIGLDEIAEAVDKPIVEIRDIMGNLAGGDFAHKVVGDYAGDFLEIKNAVNSTIDALSVYIEEISKTLAAVSGGDLTTSISREYVGSFGAIKESLNNISKTLHKTMSEISSASEQVLSGAKQISTSAQDLANGAQEQASSVEELNASIDVINQQTRQNANNASEANELSAKSSANAQEGNEAMKQMLLAMTQIKESSSEISKIIKAIQDIAFQTNLLALNASVEAARAGEHGRGFSVVAEEVRNLAGRSQDSVNETTGLIETSNNRVESGSSIAETTSKSLDTIVVNAAEVSQIIKDIASASNEQAEAIAQVSQGLDQISKVVQNNSAVSEETAAASQELSSQAEILQQLVAYFKL
ncbi:MAG: methyl-accepting chemotaxis protein [Defluviitaleaceae bacterium]|nr:methyl-accepting chemotaxis protein [Defluviitaleaceae bacterium]